MSSTRFFQTDPSASPSSIHSWEASGRRYARTRETTLRLIGPLSPEDCSAQSMPDASPVKWHLAHTSWFFETFILESYVPRYQCYHPRYRYLFNVYDNAIGERHARHNRGLLPRPSFHEIIEYREYVDAAMAWLFRDADQETQQEIAPLIVLGCNHEQQHQELILTDIKHLLFQNPLQPEYFEEQTQAFAN